MNKTLLAISIVFILAAIAGAVVSSVTLGTLVGPNENDDKIKPSTNVQVNLNSSGTITYPNEKHDAEIEPLNLAIVASGILIVAIAALDKRRRDRKRNV